MFRAKTYQELLFDLYHKYYEAGRLQSVLRLRNGGVLLGKPHERKSGVAYAPQLGRVGYDSPEG
jgi:hypothetical protein